MFISLSENGDDKSLKKKKKKKDKDREKENLDSLDRAERKKKKKKDKSKDRERSRSKEDREKSEPKSITETALVHDYEQEGSPVVAENTEESSVKKSLEDYQTTDRPEATKGDEIDKLAHFQYQEVTQPAEAQSPREAVESKAPSGLNNAVGDSAVGTVEDETGVGKTPGDVFDKVPDIEKRKKKKKDKDKEIDKDNDTASSKKKRKAKSKEREKKNEDVNEAKEDSVERKVEGEDESVKVDLGEIPNFR